MKSLLREALSEAIEFAEMDLHALTPAGEAMVQRWRDALSAPDVGVGLTRYDLLWGAAGSVMKPTDDGEWVRYEDVAPLLAALDAPAPGTMTVDDLLDQIAAIKDEYANLRSEALDQMELWAAQGDAHEAGRYSTEAERHGSALFASSRILRLVTTSIGNLDAVRERRRGDDFVRGWWDANASLGIAQAEISRLREAITVSETARIAALEDKAAALSGRKPDTKEGTTPEDFDLRAKFAADALDRYLPDPTRDRAVTMSIAGNVLFAAGVRPTPPEAQ